MNYRYGFLLGIVFAFGCSSNVEQEARLQNITQKSQALAQEFGAMLKHELQQALETSGPLGAIEVCKTVAMQTEERFSTADPQILRFRRISLKTRNPAHHTPTAAEADWLRAQEEALKKGEQSSRGLIATEDRITVLFPIVLDNPLCLTCHGDLQYMPDDFKETLAKNYPDDQATGYVQGDFRGAIAIEWKK